MFELKDSVGRQLFETISITLVRAEPRHQSGVAADASLPVAGVRRLPADGKPGEVRSERNPLP